VERLNNSVSMVIQLWKPISFGNPEDGDDRFSKTDRFELVLHGTKSQKTSLIDIVVKAFQKTGLPILIVLTAAEKK
jgi:hypothetical protein